MVIKKVVFIICCIFIQQVSAYESQGLFAPGVEMQRSIEYLQNSSLSGLNTDQAVGTILLENGVYHVSVNIQVRITYRTFIVTNMQGQHVLVPGSKIQYSIGMYNDSTVTANNCVVRDVVPNNTHLYYVAGSQPQLTGGVSNVVYIGPNTNAGGGSLLGFTFSLAPRANAQFTYTVIVD